MKLEKNSRQPLYVQLMAELKQQIRSGKYTAGDKIPTEPELADMYGVSRITVRKTIEQLCKEGYLVKQQGKGTFVESPRLHRKLEMKKSVSFSEVCRSHGAVPTSHVLSSRIVASEKWQRSFLMLDEEDQLIEIRRILSSDGMAIMLDSIYLPEKRFAGFEATKLENGSLYGLLSSQFGMDDFPESDSTIEASIADRESADLLDILPGEPLLIMINYQYDKDGNPSFITCDQIIGSRYRISI